jgi:phenylacetate-CoA ligase
VQITPGYGLWTAGIGFQAGVEKISAMAIPMGPGNTEKQLEMMVNLKSTVLISTSSYALLLAEQVAQRDIKDKICLKKGIIGSERWSSKMRQRICNELDIEAFDIYGLTEVYGPGISIDCTQHNGLHYWDDYLYFEIIDPNTAEVLPMGEEGELVITTLKKEGAPLIRYRTRDITRLIPGECACGMKYPRHDLIKGRSDDMIKIKGVNIFPTQIDEVLQAVEGVSSEYRVEINREDGKDIMLLIFEAEVLDRAMLLMEKVSETFKRKIGITIATRAVAIGDLPRSEKKTKRIIDNRY